jgi:hypothetical protein
MIPLKPDTRTARKQPADLFDAERPHREARDIVIERATRSRLDLPHLGPDPADVTARTAGLTRSDP